MTELDTRRGAWSLADRGGGHDASLPRSISVVMTRGAKSKTCGASPWRRRVCHAPLRCQKRSAQFKMKPPAAAAFHTEDRSARTQPPPRCKSLSLRPLLSVVSTLLPLLFSGFRVVATFPFLSTSPPRALRRRNRVL